ncbi:hypothetical protein [Streptomyces sp. HD]|uniref:hypothetical protein n=1 Tax=Streptomyces sp. HD TaxID=3020892 RepID=UPI00232BFB68|nr:hypothetical protein [Streptomyces sp. HD]MDC0767505.1 hypothetical protein [Streptomyces sp. HD]
MKIITAVALAGAALLAAALPAHADEGPLDFGFFQGVNESKGTNSTDPNPAWGQTDGGANDAVPKSALTALVNELTSPRGH